MFTYGNRSLVQWIVSRASNSEMWVRFLQDRPNNYGGYGVMVAPDSVKVVAWDRYPLVTPSFVSVDVVKVGTRNPCELSGR